MEKHRAILTYKDWGKLVSNLDRGVRVLVMLGLLSYTANRTKFGRYVYSVGGNKEAACRADIRLERISVTAQPATIWYGLT